MIKHVRNTIVKGLHDYLNVTIVPIESLETKQEYPYLTYNITSPYIPEPYMPDISSRTVDSIDKEFKDDVIESYKEQPQMVISINSYSRDKLESQELAKKAADYLKYHGYEFFNDENIVIVDVMSLANRTIRIVDHYEHRTGFDVKIRVTDVVEVREKTIETLDIRMEE